MTHYIVQVIAFQLLFLVVYDFFLKKETFFNWNRTYLLLTPVLSFIIPFIELNKFKGVVPQDYIVYLPEVIVGNLSSSVLEEASLKFSLWQLLLLLGSLVSLVIFVFKLYKLYKLKNTNDRILYSNYTKIVIKNSNTAFSFFKNIFLGEEVLKKEYQHILDHELIHVKQKHSIDLIFFELLKVIMWFNPLIYSYQNRMVELHEFIADASVAKSNKKEHYQRLLSEIFDTDKISFINQFFNASLIKKRIIMLQKSKSKKVWQLKYLLILPLILSMLIYSSCENKDLVDDSQELRLEDELNAILEAIENEELSDADKEKLYLLLEEKREKLGIQRLDSINIVGYSKNDRISEAAKKVPFSVIDNVPVFPGCEDATDKRTCFKEKIQAHIRKNFRYPEIAQEKGIQGRVSVLFTIDEKGEIKNIKMRGPDELLENEVLRIIKKLPKMTPGTQKGKPVEVPYSIPVTFKLQ